MLPPPIARTHAPDAAQVAPGTHLLCRFLAVTQEGDQGETQRLRRAVEIAARVTEAGGIISQVHRSGEDPDEPILIVALLSAAQAIALLAADAYGQARESCAPQLALGPLDDTAASAWIGQTDEDARRLGVARLSRLLASCGVAGDTGARADQLWTECGY